MSDGGGEVGNMQILQEDIYRAGDSAGEYIARIEAFLREVHTYNLIILLAVLGYVTSEYMNKAFDREETGPSSVQTDKLFRGLPGLYGIYILKTPFISKKYGKEVVSEFSVYTSNDLKNNIRGPLSCITGSRVEQTQP